MDEGRAPRIRGRGVTRRLLARSKIGGSRPVGGGQTQTVLRWLEAFPDGVVEHDTHLSLARAWAG